MIIKEKIEWRYCHFLKHRYPYLWCRRLYRKTFGKSANFSNPKDINEKILWMSFFTDTSIWSLLADKYAVREYVKERISDDILVPLLGKWDRTEDIDFDSLPLMFVIKPNNGSYDCVVVKDKSRVDCESIRASMHRSLQIPFGYEHAERHYLDIKPCIIAEELLEDPINSSPIDYKIWCLNGKLYCVFVVGNRNIINHTADYACYDEDWKRRPELIAESFRSTFECPRPKNLDLMIQYAEKLAEGLPQVRVDFYNIEGKIYFGEMTLTSNYGMMTYFTKEVLDEMGGLCVLPKRNFREKISAFIKRWKPLVK